MMSDLHYTTRDYIVQGTTDELKTGNYSLRVNVGCYNLQTISIGADYPPEITQWAVGDLVWAMITPLKEASDPFRIVQAEIPGTTFVTDIDDCGAFNMSLY
jgi:hypothetical protein